MKLAPILLAFLIGCQAAGPVVPTYVTEYANALCRGDAAYLAANAKLGASEQEIAYYFSAGRWHCSSARYLGQLEGEGGDQYIFVLTKAPHDEQWWIITVRAGEIVMVQ